MKIRSMGAALALALGTVVGGGAAHATTYLLDTSSTFGTGSFGQVTVTGSSTDLHFDVKLFDSYQTIDTGSHYSFSGNLSGTISQLVLPSAEMPGGAADFTLTTGSSLSNSPFSGFDFALNCTVCGSGASSPYHLQEWTFDITGTGLSVLAADPYNDENIYFAADVTNADGATGAIGGGPGTAVPEPMTWSLMIMGVFGIGAMMRQRRAMNLA